MSSYYAIVTFGGSFPGRTVFTSKDEAKAAILQAEQDTMAGKGRLVCDQAVLARVRINEYQTRAAARKADISDTTDDSRGRRTPGFVQAVFIRG
jgi:hypothetical protein